MNLLKVLLQLGPHPQMIGYVGRNRLEAFYPELAPVHEYRDALNTLWSLETNSGQKPFSITANGKDFGQCAVVARVHTAGQGRNIAPPALFTRARRVIEQQLGNHKAHREPLVEWLLSKPLVRIPFASHNKAWEWRK